MGWIDETVTEFGRQVGIEALAMNRHGNTQLTLGNNGLLTVEPARRGDREEVLVYLGRVVGHQLPLLNRIALAKAHHANGSPLPLQVVCQGQGPGSMLLAVTRFPERSFTPQALMHAADYLARWLDEVQAGSRR